MARIWRYILTIVAGTVLVGALALGPANKQPPQPAQSAPTHPTTAPATQSAIAEPLDLVPAESLLCWYGRPFPGMDPSSDRPSALNTVLNLGSRLAGSALDAEAKLWARAAEAFNLSIRCPHAFVLIDAQAKPSESNPAIKQGDKIRFALIVKTGGGDQNQAFARIVQAALNEQTDKDNATLQRRKAGPWEYLELRDERLPDWCTIAWGAIEQYFVFAIGPDVWPTIAAVGHGEAAALSRSDWLVKARDQRGRDALIEIIVAVEDIRARLDPLVDNRATGFFRAWQADQYERAHWVLGFDGPALYCVAHVIQQGHMRKLTFADPDIREPRLLATIPEGSRYAIYDFPPSKIFPRFFSSVLATRGAKDQQSVNELWARIQAEHGFNAERDILAHLGRHMVMHNYPPHPLHFPLAMTTLTEIQDEPAKVRQTIDTMCQAWQDDQIRRAEEGHPPDLMTIGQDADGIWSLRYGLAGPAWIVTDRFIITSWSPTALRAYLEKAGEHVGLGSTGTSSQ